MFHNRAALLASCFMYEYNSLEVCLEDPNSASIKELNTKVYALKFKGDVLSIANKICVFVLRGL